MGSPAGAAPLPLLVTAALWCALLASAAGQTCSPAGIVDFLSDAPGTLRCVTAFSSPTAPLQTVFQCCARAAELRAAQCLCDPAVGSLLAQYGPQVDVLSRAVPTFCGEPLGATCGSAPTPPASNTTKPCTPAQLIDLVAPAPAGRDCGSIVGQTANATAIRRCCLAAQRASTAGCFCAPELESLRSQFSTTLSGVLNTCSAQNVSLQFGAACTANATPPIAVTVPPPQPAVPSVCTRDSVQALLQAPLSCADASASAAGMGRACCSRIRELDAARCFCRGDISLASADAAADLLLTLSSAAQTCGFAPHVGDPCVPIPTAAAPAPMLAPASRAPPPELRRRAGTPRPMAMAPSPQAIGPGAPRPTAPAPQAVVPAVCAPQALASLVAGNGLACDGVLTNATLMAPDTDSLGQLMQYVCCDQVRILDGQLCFCQPALQPLLRQFQAAFADVFAAAPLVCGFPVRVGIQCTAAVTPSPPPPPPQEVPPQVQQPAPGPPPPEVTLVPLPSAVQPLQPSPPAVAPTLMLPPEVRPSAPPPPVMRQLQPVANEQVVQAPSVATASSPASPPAQRQEVAAPPPADAMKPPVAAPVPLEVLCPPEQVVNVVTSLRCDVTLPAFLNASAADRSLGQLLPFVCCSELQQLNGHGCFCRAAVTKLVGQYSPSFQQVFKAAPQVCGFTVRTPGPLCGAAAPVPAAGPASQLGLPHLPPAALGGRAGAPAPVSAVGVAPPPGAPLGQAAPEQPMQAGLPPPAELPPAPQSPPAPEPPAPEPPPAPVPQLPPAPSSPTSPSPLEAAPTGQPLVEVVPPPPPSPVPPVPPPLPPVPPPLPPPQPPPLPPPSEPQLPLLFPMRSPPPVAVAAPPAQAALSPPTPLPAQPQLAMSPPVLAPEAVVGIPPIGQGPVLQLRPLPTSPVGIRPPSGAQGGALTGREPVRVPVPSALETLVTTPGRPPAIIAAPTAPSPTPPPLRRLSPEEAAQLFMATLKAVPPPPGAVRAIYGAQPLRPPPPHAAGTAQAGAPTAAAVIACSTAALLAPFASEMACTGLGTLQSNASITAACCGALSRLAAADCFCTSGAAPALAVLGRDDLIETTGVIAAVCPAVCGFQLRMPLTGSCTAPAPPQTRGGTGQSAASPVAPASPLAPRPAEPVPGNLPPRASVAQPPPSSELPVSYGLPPRVPPAGTVTAPAAAPAPAMLRPSSGREQPAQPVAFGAPPPQSARPTSAMMASAMPSSTTATANAPPPTTAVSPPPLELHLPSMVHVTPVPSVTAPSVTVLPPLPSAGGGRGVPAGERPRRIVPPATQQFPPAPPVPSAPGTLPEVPAGAGFAPGRRGSQAKMLLMPEPVQVGGQSPHMRAPTAAATAPRVRHGGGATQVVVSAPVTATATVSHGNKVTVAADVKVTTTVQPVAARSSSSSSSDGS